MNSIIFLATVLLLVVLQSTVDATRPDSVHGIFVVEDSTTEPSGIFVTTTTHHNNYAIVSPRLNKLGWLAVSVNGNLASVLLEKGNVTFGKLSSLSADQRDIFDRIRTGFLLNLPELSFSSWATKALPAEFSVLPSNALSGGAIIGGRNPFALGGSIARNFKSSGIGFQNLATNNIPAYSNPVFNYYNLLQTPLNVSLTGDVYFLDLYGNALDIYSSSLSVCKKPSQSILYRDQSYFIYHRSSMPLTINRIILSDRYVVFVYNDLNVLAKAIWQLSPIELELVLSAQVEIKKLINSVPGERVSESATNKAQAQQQPSSGERLDGIKEETVVKEEDKIQVTSKGEQASTVEDNAKLAEKEEVVVKETLAKDTLEREKVEDKGTSEQLESATTKEEETTTAPPTTTATTTSSATTIEEPPKEAASVESTGGGFVDSEQVVTNQSSV